MLHNWSERDYGLLDNEFCRFDIRFVADLHFSCSYMLSSMRCVGGGGMRLVITAQEWGIRHEASSLVGGEGGDLTIVVGVRKYKYHRIKTSRPDTVSVSRLNLFLINTQITHRHV